MFLKANLLALCKKYADTGEMRLRRGHICPTIADEFCLMRVADCFIFHVTVSALYCSCPPYGCDGHFGQRFFQRSNFLIHRTDDPRFDEFKTRSPSGIIASFERQVKGGVPKCHDFFCKTACFLWTHSFTMYMLCIIPQQRKRIWF